MILLYLSFLVYINLDVLMQMILCIMLGIHCAVIQIYLWYLTQHVDMVLFNYIYYHS